MAGAGRRDHVCMCSLNSGMDVFLLGLRGMGWACGRAESVGCWSQLPQASQPAVPTSSQLSSVASSWKLKTSWCEYLRHRNQQTLQIRFLFT